MAHRALISLGYRCDIGFQLRLHGAENTAHFFDWLATPAQGVVTILDRNFDVFHADHLEHRPGEPSDAVLDRVTGTLFWHQFPIAGGRIPVEFLLFHPQFHAKFAFLAQRFRTTVATRPVTLVRDVIKQEEAVLLEQSFFRRFPNADAQFLYIVATEKAGFTTPAGHSVVLPTTDRSLGDPAAWAAMLRAEKLIDLPYRRSTVEILGHEHDDYNLSPDNRFTEAELILAGSLNPGSAELKAELAQFYLVNHRLDEAHAQLAAALAIKPDQADWQIERIVAQWRDNEIPTSTAIEAVSRLPGPRHIFQRHEYVRLLLEAGQFAAAHAVCSASLSRSARDPITCRYKAEACLRLERKLEAEAAIDRSLSLAPDEWRTHSLRSDIMASLGRMVKAGQAARRALELDDNAETRAAVARLRARAAA